MEKDRQQGRGGHLHGKAVTGVQKWIAIGLCVGMLLVMASCGRKSMVVLVPDPDGSVGAITVTNAAGSTDMTRAHQATTVRRSTTPPSTPVHMTPEAVQATFADVLANQLPPPVHFLLYFHSNSIRMLPDSKNQFPAIMDVIRKRMPTRISVVGHSDTEGNKAYNLKLSLRRAEAIKRILVKQGIAATFIDVSSHGEENPLVKTGDNVANARNRRVEVVVR